MDPLFAQLQQRLRQRPGRPLNLPGLELREAAVLVPLFLRRGVPFALFTKRPATLRTHAGQISFPGGSRDGSDATPLHTALRETEEELGLPKAEVTVLGLLHEIPTITEFRIAPFVGVIPDGYPLRPNPEEIDRVIEVPIPHLMDRSSQRVERLDVRGQLRDVYFFDYGEDVIWGATARILKDLLEVLSELPSWCELLVRKT